MNKDEKVDRINTLIRKSRLDLPSFRKTVTTSGKNIHWLLKNIGFKNSNVPDELMDLLRNF